MTSILMCSDLYHDHSRATARDVGTTIMPHQQGLGDQGIIIIVRCFFSIVAICLTDRNILPMGQFSCKVQVYSIWCMNTLTKGPVSL